MNDAPFATVKVGHWTDHEARTGCTVVVFDRPCLAAVDVRGGAPATRETDLLAPGRLVQRVDAIVLTGGSAFGLAVADGVVSELAMLGRGFPTSVLPVPIVPAAALFDLGVGQAKPPDSESGRFALRNAVPLKEIERGPVGVGIGTSTARPPAFGGEQPGGIGLGTVRWERGSISALVAVNAVGAVQWTRPDVIPQDHDAPVRRQDARWAMLDDYSADQSVSAGTATTLGVVVIEGPCRHDDLIRCAVSAHDGLARSISPSHTPFDGDLFFVVALSEGDTTQSELMKICVGTELAVEAAIADSVRIPTA